MKKILSLVSLLFALQHYSFSQNQQLIDTLEAQLKNIDLGSHRLSVFWNAFPSWKANLPAGITDSYDVAIKNLLLTVNNQGDWTLESDQQTEVSTMTLEQFHEKYPLQEGARESFQDLHQTRSESSDRKKFSLSMKEANGSKVGIEAKPAKKTNLTEPAEKPAKFKANWTIFWIVVGLFSFLFIILRFTKVNRN